MRPTDSTSNDTATLAYQLWEKDGRPDGRDMEYWLKAEAQLRGKQGSQTTQNGQGNQANRQPSQNGAAQPQTSVKASPAPASQNQAPQSDADKKKKAGARRQPAVA